MRADAPVTASDHARLRWCQRGDVSVTIHDAWHRAEEIPVPVEKRVRLDPETNTALVAANGTITTVLPVGQLGHELQTAVDEYRRQSREVTPSE